MAKCTWHPKKKATHEVKLRPSGKWLPACTACAGDVKYEIKQGNTQVKVREL